MERKEGGNGEREGQMMGGMAIKRFKGIGYSKDNELNTSVEKVCFTGILPNIQTSNSFLDPSDYASQTDFLFEGLKYN